MLALVSFVRSMAVALELRVIGGSASAASSLGLVLGVIGLGVILLASYYAPRS